MSAVLTPIKALASSITRRLSSGSVTAKSDATEATPMKSDKALPLPPPPQKEEMVAEQAPEGDHTACRIHIVDVGAARVHLYDTFYLTAIDKRRVAPRRPCLPGRPLLEHCPVRYHCANGHTRHGNVTDTRKRTCPLRHL